MSNIMSLGSLKNKPSRNGFDLSRKNAFSAKAGELLPVLTEECLPGDKFKINTQWLTRTRPLNTAAYTRLREYVDFFFVPSRLLWRWSDAFYTQMDVQNSALSLSEDGDFGVPSRLPWCTSYDIQSLFNKIHSEDSNLNVNGFSRNKASIKLLSYLDYGNCWSEFFKDDDVYSDGTWSYSDRPLNLMPLAAYQKIYHDYFRFEQWENMNANEFNFDYLTPDTSSASSYVDVSQFSTSSTSLFDLRYSNFNKDLFMGLLPNSQYGASAEINIASLALPASGVKQLVGIDNRGLHVAIGGTVTAPNLGSETLAKDFNLGILALRQAEALQKYKEIKQTGKSDYQDQIEKQWNVNISNSRSNLCDYVGGITNNINIREEVNTNLDSTNKPTIKGKGVGAKEGYIDFTAPEHGYFMAIYHVQPLLDWDDLGTAPHIFAVDFEDIANPLFDKIGMEKIPFEWMSNDARSYYPSEPSPTDDGSNWSAKLGSGMGFAPRYIRYKTQIDKVHGALCSTLRDWVAMFDQFLITQKLSGVADGDPDSEYIARVNYSWFKVNPSILDSIFGVAANDDISTDQFLTDMWFDFKAVRNLDVNGLPY